ncbi:MAG TPA: M1 family peptidase, partial [Cyclobacteriaceae bacterium]|nr:M1 family peptidase [Cyclobacteriaceae bacterium]
GSITPERSWWDVLHYGIVVIPDYNTKTISGVVELKVKAIASGKRLQIDLQEPMQLDRATMQVTNLASVREGNVYYWNIE